MEAELNFYRKLSSLVNQRLIENLNDRLIATSKKKKKDTKKKPDFIKKDNEHIKEKKIKTVTLSANNVESDYESKESSESSSLLAEDGSENDYESSEAIEEEKFQFSNKKDVSDVSLKNIKGKNLFHKKRLAEKQERIDALNPEEAKMNKILKAAAGQKLDMTTSQIDKMIKKKAKEKAKRAEIRKKKEEKKQKEIEKETLKQKEKAEQAGRVFKGYKPPKVNTSSKKKKFKPSKKGFKK